MLELDSRPFDLATFERAAEVLGTGPTWNAFEVLPPRFAELPAGPSQPELPGRGMTATYSGPPASPDSFGGTDATGAYPGADRPGALPDFRDDLPRAGRGFATADPTAYFGTGSNRGHVGGERTASNRMASPTVRLRTVADPRAPAQVAAARGRAAR